jgi:RimJ/RimL family protein N-acetyltransferase
MRIRPCRGSDRRSLRQLGHLPDVVALLSPGPITRWAWAAHRTKVLSFVAEDPSQEGLAGTVQLVRSRLDPGTWMFGHWRVAPDRRGEGLGGALLRGALRRTAAVKRLYSLIEQDNGASIEAHERLGFERSERLCGGGGLGFLSTIGPPAPALSLRRPSRDDLPEIFEIYLKSMGPLWGRLFPGLSAARLLRAVGEPPDPSLRRPAPATLPERLMLVEDGGGCPAFLARGGRSTALFADPGRCDAGLLARVASRLLAQGAARDEWLTLRGLPAPPGRPAGAIRAWILMGTADVDRLRGRG